jgi:hypothetical protein
VKRPHSPDAVRGAKELAGQNPAPHPERGVEGSVSRIDGQPRWPPYAVRLSKDASRAICPRTKLPPCDSEAVGTYVDPHGGRINGLLARLPLRLRHHANRGKSCVSDSLEAARHTVAPKGPGCGSNPAEDCYTDISLHTSTRCVLAGGTSQRLDRFQILGEGGCSGVRRAARRRAAQGSAVGQREVAMHRLLLGIRPKRCCLERCKGLNGFMDAATGAGQCGRGSVHTRVSFDHPAPRRTEPSVPRAASTTTDTTTIETQEPHGVRMAGTVRGMCRVHCARPRLQQGRTCECPRGITYTSPEARAPACATWVPSRRTEHCCV